LGALERLLAIIGRHGERLHHLHAVVTPVRALRFDARRPARS
jgi:hypothetical protein